MAYLGTFTVIYSTHFASRYADLFFRPYIQPYLPRRDSINQFLRDLDRQLRKDPDVRATYTTSYPDPSGNGASRPAFVIEESLEEVGSFPPRAWAAIFVTYEILQQDQQVILRELEVVPFSWAAKP